ncbi:MULTISPECIES: PPK2 family polyphosphate kinase [Aestuariibaculum]|uniref:Polyphosphate kinase 2 family protein n=1 Tax=Aestuariibaculum marinum TaxID=2683592 RepID=A0A8J6Q1W9_9FLAO|nr:MULTISPECIES: PPK2 family polyphosphate kinase [Aestuariibaculum]MBD0824042.1 polyphosphate kinase 2 family protein [Aestuariibaculum marinum]WMI65649.1 polyphosphate kinase 2 family protein [Aestuariibaculum sp. YM273]
MEKYKVTSNISLKELETKVVIDDAKKELKKVRKKLGKIQDTMYAHGKYAVLVCLQGMDTAGKDSLIREVFKDFNTRGIIVHSFKVPTDLELKHDYLWRHYIALPARGKFGIFNRTHYENVLVTRVHPEYILGENLPTVTKVEDVNDAFWDKRFQQINEFEQHIAENGTIIFKFFLNLSKKEQKERLLRRLEKQEKNWKFSPGDLKERKEWDDYQVCYEDAINRTSMPHAPWYTIPADDKESARYIVAKIMYDTLKEYKDIEEPELDEDILENLHLYKAQLESED